MKQNLALIIGAMKSGTTTLFDHLAAHPQVAGCHPKEPGYFAFDEIYDRGETWYHSLFSFDPDRHLVALDASTDYSKYPHCGDVLGRIEHYGAHPKLLYIMRHPLRRIESHSRHVQFTHREVGQKYSPIENHSLDSGISQVSLDLSKYATQIAQYQRYFDTGRLMLLTLEELNQQPRETMEKVCRFLEIDSALLFDGLKNLNRGSNVRRKNEPHPLWRTAQSVRPLHSLAKRLIPIAIRETLRKQTAQKITLEGRFRLTPAEEEAILAELAPDLRMLRDFYQVDIERHWCIVI